MQDNLLLHIGPQKTGTTWIYRNLSEHPEISTSNSDKIHYYDIYFYRGQDWYLQQFTSNVGGKKFDPTFTYIRSPLAPKRIAQEYSKARMALCMRNPIERAFSHYWHEKKKGTITFDFKDVLENYDLFASWIEPGFYAEHIERYLEYFDSKQILAQRFERITNEPKIFLQELCEFYGIDSSYEFTWTDKKANVARPRQNLLGRFEQKVIHGQEKLTSTTQRFTQPAVNMIKKWNETKNYEYITNTDVDVLKALYEICIPEIDRLEKMTNEDLNDWKKYD